MFSLINLRSFFLALVPVLGIYLILPGVTLDVLILIVLLGIEMVLKRRFLVNYKTLVLFSVLFFCNVISFIFSTTSVQSIFINNSIQMITFALLLCYYIQQPVNSVFVKTLTYVGVFASFFVYFQFVAFWIFDQSITLFLPLDTSVENLLDLVSIGYGRPNSVFLEPAHFAIFILPLFFYSLMNKKYILSFIYFFGLLLSTSTTGFAISIFILLYHFIYQKKNIVLFLMVGVLLIPLFIYQDIFSFIFDNNLDKLGTDSMGENDRFLGTIPLIFRMDFFSWIFGLGYNQMSDFFMSQGVFVNNYSNSYFMSFFSFGFIGFLALLYYLMPLFKINSSKGYFFIFLLILSSDQILFNRNFFYLICCIYFLKDSIPDESVLFIDKEVILDEK